MRWSIKILNGQVISMTMQVGYAGEGFGLTSGRRGAPEQISIGSIGDRNAFTYESDSRDQDWCSANAGTTAHGLYGFADTEVRDDFYWY